MNNHIIMLTRLRTRIQEMKAANHIALGMKPEEAIKVTGKREAYDDVIKLLTDGINKLELKEMGLV